MTDDHAALALEHANAARQWLDKLNGDGRDDDAMVKLSQTLEMLQKSVVASQTQRIIVLSGFKILDCGIQLYNASRNAMRLCDADQMKEMVFVLMRSRFLACEVMRLALSGSRDTQDRVASNGTAPSTFVDECIDIMRSFGRVGEHLLANAARDPARSDQYLKMTRDALDCGLGLWSRIGISCLKRRRSGLEFEEILEDVWNCCCNRVRVSMAMSADSASSNDHAAEIVDVMQDLRMLIPYLPSFASDLMVLLGDISDLYKNYGCWEKQCSFTEVALRLVDVVRSTQDEVVELADRLKQQLLKNSIDAWRSLGEVGRAEQCFALLPQKHDCDAAQAMVQLYSANKLFDKAVQAVRGMFQQSEMTESLQAVRIVANALSFDERAMSLFRELTMHYGEHALEINIDLACSLALSSLPEHRNRAMHELKQLLSDTSRNDRSSHVQRITQTVHEATQHAVNHSLHEEAIDWAELGVALSSSAQALARNFRVLSLSNLQLGRVEMAGTFANQAYEADKSKKSLLALFRANIRDEPGRDAPSKEHTKYLLSLLVRQHDFRFEDLLVFGKASNEAKDDESTLLVLEEMIGLLRSQRQSKSAPIPAGVILQNAGQLAYNAVEKRNSDTSTVFIKRFKALSESFVEFAEQLAPGDVADFGPVETFEWFYAMSFMLGKSLEDSEMFLSASRVAQLANELYGDKSPLHAQQSQSLLACIAMDMASFETHDIEYLKQILVLIDQYGTMKKELSHETADTESFLVKCALAIKLRAGDMNLDGIYLQCQEKTNRSTDDFVELGELVLHALKYDESIEIRQQQKALARKFFQNALQIMLQGTSVDTSKFSYLFRRLINLADEPSQVSEWLDQLLQLSESMGLNISGDDIEWFTGRAWNMGVRHCQAREIATGTAFMKTALSLLERNLAVKGKLEAQLREQYQHVVSGTFY